MVEQRPTQEAVLEHGCHGAVLQIIGIKSQHRWADALTGSPVGNADESEFLPVILQRSRQSEAAEDAAG